MHIRRGGENLKVFMIGGTGLLGSAGAKELIEKGHKVTSLSLPEIPEGADIPKEMKLVTGDYMKLSDEEIHKFLKGMDGFIFAAGIDDRVSGPPPVYDLYKKYNNDPLERFLEIAKEEKVKHCVVLGSYFSYFDRIWPKMKLAENNPYIRSRVDQETIALMYADQDMSVAILELPYIFGVQKGRKPVWTILVENILSMKDKTMYPKGGTTMITVRQVGQCIAGALEKTEGGKCYPVGYYNMTWVELLRLFHKGMGCPEKEIVTIPTFLFAMAGRKTHKENLKNNIESGLNMGKFAKAFASNMFIDKKEIEPLGVTEDDIEQAVIDSVKLSMESINGKKLVEMKVSEDK